MFYKNLLLASASALFLIAAPVSAQEKAQELANPVVTQPELPAEAASANENAEKPKQEAATQQLRDPNQVICKKSVKTSTRLRRKKICKTRARWDEERSATRDAINEVKAQTRVDQYD